MLDIKVPWTEIEKTVYDSDNVAMKEEGYLDHMYNGHYIRAYSVYIYDDKGYRKGTVAYEVAQFEATSIVNAIRSAIADGLSEIEFDKKWNLVK